MNTVPFYAYILISLFLSIFLITKSDTKYKFVTSILVYWLFTGPTLNTEYFIIDIKGWYFDIQPSRFIFVIFTIYLIVALMMRYRMQRIERIGKDRKEQQCKVPNPIYEKFLYLFLVFYFIAGLTHLDDVLSLREFVASFSHLLTFFVIYLVLKYYADNGMIKTLFQTIVIVCAISSIVGIYQYAVDPEFLRIGLRFRAYGEAMRANGIYGAEYFQGSFLLTGLAIVLITIKSKFKKIPLVLLILVGIVCTFHRATWFITVLVLIMYMLMVIKMRLWKFAIICTVVSVVFYSYLTFNPDFFTEYEDTSFIEERLMVDTHTDRLMLYEMAINRIPQHFLFGVGSPASDVYLQGVLRAGGSLDVAMGEVGGIHNLYLLIAFFQGVPAALFFTLFCFTCLVFFLRRVISSGVFFFAATTTIVTYFAQNLLNMLYIYGDFGLFLGIMLALSINVYQRETSTREIVHL